MPEGDKEGWRFDLRINLPLIITLLGMSFGGVWQASILWSALDENRRRIINLESQTTPLLIQVTRVEAILQSVDDRMADLLDRIKTNERVHYGRGSVDRQNPNEN